MAVSKENKEDRFRRLAEVRVNKIIAMIRLLGNLSSRSIYAYTLEQVEQIFTALQLELTRAKTRFLQSPGQGRSRFSLSNSTDAEETVPEEEPPAFVIALPDGTYLRAVGYQNIGYPCINIYWDNGINEPTEPLCFVEFNPEREGKQRVCIGAYQADEEDTTYYEPYITAERELDE